MQNLGLDGSKAEFFKEEQISTLYKLFLKLEKNAPKLVLLCQYHPDAQTRKRYNIINNNNIVDKYFMSTDMKILSNTLANQIQDHNTPGVYVKLL